MTACIKSSALKPAAILPGAYTPIGPKLGIWADVKAPAVELSKRGLYFCNTTPLFDNLNPGALTQPNPREFFSRCTSLWPIGV